MITRAAVLLAGAALLCPEAVAAPRRLPAKVMDALRARFPDPQIRTWTVEKENGIVLYDIEFTQAGRRLEADIREDGAIHNWEKEVPVESLPAAVRKAVEDRYRRGVIRQAMEITALQDGRDTPEGYEVTLKTAAGKTVELTVTGEGKIVEDSGAKVARP